jgi:cytochrome c-type biogenesis protein CcmH/NrfG
MGDIRRTSGNPQAALESYQRALELAPRWMEPKWGMAQSLWMNDLVAALPVLDELLLVDPFEERFLSLRIRYCDKHRIPAEYERAELLLRRYVALKPNDGHAWRILGTLLCFNQRFEAAIPCLRRALLHGTGSSWAWNNLAFALAVGGGNLNAAEHACHRALDIDHKTPQFWDTLGVIAMKRGRLADARSAFETALRFAPNAVDTRANLAEACRRLRALSPMGGDTR